jgi:hypothetical protein
MTDLKLMSFEELQKKIALLKEDRGVDLSTEEDLSVAVMNLISLEEHFFFSGAKTGKEEYYNMLNEVREMRKVLLARMIDKQMFTFAYKIFNLFFGLRLKIISTAEIQGTLEKEKPMNYDDIMAKLVDCCKE